MPAIIELVSMGYGISFVFESHLRRRAEDLSIDRFSFGEPRMASDFVTAYRNGSHISNYAWDFIEIARRVGNTVSESGE